MSKRMGHSTTRAFGLGFNEYWLIQRDTVNNRLLLQDVDVISDNELGWFIVDLSNVVLTGVKHSGEDKLIRAKDAFGAGNLALLIGAPSATSPTVSSSKPVRKSQKHLTPMTTSNVSAYSTEKATKRLNEIQREYQGNLTCTKKTLQILT